MPTVAPPPAPDGATVFATYCARCHGLDGHGGPGVPPNAGLPAPWVLDMVRSGSPAGMPAFSTSEISDAELQVLADYVSSLP